MLINSLQRLKLSKLAIQKNRFRKIGLRKRWRVENFPVLSHLIAINRNIIYLYL